MTRCYRQPVQLSNDIDAGASGLRLLFRLWLLSLLGDVIVVACLFGKALPLLGKLSPCLLIFLAAAACGHGQALRRKSTVLVASVLKHYLTRCPVRPVGYLGPTR